MQNPNSTQKTIFITGATGFIGQHLCHKLHGLGHNIVALIRNPKKASILPKGITVIQGDLTCFKDPNFQIPKSDLVIHLAGTVTANKQSDYKKYNYDAVVDLVNCLNRQSWTPQRILFSSSLAATGPSQINSPLTEDSPLKPVDAYGLAKKQAEEFLLDQNIPTTIFRPCAVIGPVDTNMLNLYKVAKTGFGFLPCGDPQSISFIAVQDLVNSIVAMGQEKDSKHHTYFVSHPQPTDTQSLCLAVGQSLNKKLKIVKLPRFILYIVMLINTAFSNLFNKQNVFDKKYYQQLSAQAWVCQSDKLRKELHWSPEQSLEQVVALTAHSYKEAGWI